MYVVKAQILPGGRGAGRFADDPNGKGGVRRRARWTRCAAAEAMLGHTLVTKQTGPAGRPVHRVYVEAGCDIARELYLSLLVDRDSGRVTLVASTEGGMEIEEVAADHPEKIVRVAVDPVSGISGFHARRLGHELGLTGKQVGAFNRFLPALYGAFTGLDCSIIEINPLVVTAGGDVIALDAKVSFDDSALFRHSELEKLRDEGEEDPKELEAAKYNLNYVALDGNIGCLVNGAGLAMATMDIIKLYGAAPSNFLDVGGRDRGGCPPRSRSSCRIRTSKASCQHLHGVMRCDVIAEGVVAAARVQLSVPLVVRLEGTNVQLSKEIWRNPTCRS